MKASDEVFFLFSRVPDLIQTPVRDPDPQDTFDVIFELGVLGAKNGLWGMPGRVHTQALFKTQIFQNPCRKEE
jgi:hypothetical protein